MAKYSGKPSEVGRLFQKAMTRKSAKFAKLLRATFVAEGEEWVRDVQENASTRLTVRSAELIKGIRYKMTGGAKLKNMKLKKFIGGTAINYATTQEFGTVGAGGTLPTIRAKNKAWLTIPTDLARTAGGVPLRPSARAWGRLKFVLHPSNSKADDTAFLLPQGTDALSDALYVLKKEVDVAPRLGMREAHRRQSRERLGHLVQAARLALLA